MSGKTYFSVIFLSTVKILNLYWFPYMFIFLNWFTLARWAKNIFTYKLYVDYNGKKNNSCCFFNELSVSSVSLKELCQTVGRVRKFSQDFGFLLRNFTYIRPLKKIKNPKFDLFMSFYR